MRGAARSYRAYYERNSEFHTHTHRILFIQLFPSRPLAIFHVCLLPWLGYSHPSPPLGPFAMRLYVVYSVSRGWSLFLVFFTVFSTSCLFFFLCFFANRSRFQTTAPTITATPPYSNNRNRSQHDERENADLRYGKVTRTQHTAQRARWKERKEGEDAKV